MYVYIYTRNYVRIMYCVFMYGHLVWQTIFVGDFPIVMCD